MISLVLALACAFCTGGLILAEARGGETARLIFKPAASALFILAALALGGLASPYGQAIIAGLFLCALGDVLLLSRNERAFLAGIAAFAGGHAAYIAAFILTGPAAGPAVIAAALVTGAIAWIIVRRLAPHLGSFRVPALAYITIIAVMVAAAIAASLATGDVRIAAGAVLFFISDISVARDRFIKEEFANRLWGLPLYYSAQLLLASTV